MCFALGLMWFCSDFLFAGCGVYGGCLFAVAGLVWLGLRCGLVVFRLVICCWVWLFTAFDGGLAIGLIALNLLL